MAGQGATTKAASIALTEAGWTVAYVCLPNTPHIGVVPIPTSHGVSRQRYPDILAFKGDTIRLVEVEQFLSDAVVEDISLRFREMRTSLSDHIVYKSWKDHIERSFNYALPDKPHILCDLLLCRAIPKSAQPLESKLLTDSIRVFGLGQFSP
jgi:hypothetical protein